MATELSNGQDKGPDASNGADLISARVGGKTVELERDAVVAQMVLAAGASGQNSPLHNHFPFFRHDSAFQGKRSYECALGYLEWPTPEDYRRRYERWGIANRVVEAFPEATWTGGAEIVETDTPTTTTLFEESTTNLFEQFELWQVLARADILSGIGRFGILLIGAPGELEEPMPRLESTSDILYFQPYGEDRINSVTFNNDPSDRRFGMPEIYDVEIGSGDSLSIISRQNISTRVRRIHWTRVIHIVEKPLDNEVFGKPRLEAVWNYLDDLIKVVGGGSEAFWRLANPGTKVKIPLTTPDGTPIELDEETMQELEEEVEDLVHGQTKVVKLRGVDLEQMDSRTPAFNRNADAILRLISGTTGIPTRILTGSERGELASTQDRANWNERVVTRRRDFATPLVRNLLTRLIDHRALPEPVAGDYKVSWPEAAVLDEQEKASLAETYARTNWRQGQVGLAPVLTVDEIRKRAFELQGEDTEDEIIAPPEEEPTGEDVDADFPPDIDEEEGE